MITSRYITEEDYPLLAESLEKDEYHKDTPPEFFYETDTVTSVFEDDDGVVLFVRAKGMDGFGSIIVLDIQYMDNSDARRNMKTMLTGFPIIAERAKGIGFYAMIFESIVPLLRKFCVKRLGFKEWDDKLLVKYLQEEPLNAVDEIKESVL